MGVRVVLVVLVGLCLEARAYVPQISAPLASVGSWRGSRSTCSAPPLRVAMQFQSTSSARGREADFKMPTSKPLPAKRQPEGPLEDDPTLPMIEDIIRAVDDRKVSPQPAPPPVSGRIARGVARGRQHIAGAPGGIHATVL